MKTISKLEKLKNKTNSSFLNKNNYEIQLNIDNIISNLTYWSLPMEEKSKNRRNNTQYSSKELFENIIPEFQRTNDKWNQKMQIAFVENILSGASSTISLFSISTPKTRGSKSDCRLLDGFQRLTAISSWLDGEFPIFDDIYFSDIKNENIYLWDANNFKLRIYEFENEKEVVDFYIKMNENITHSEQDIEKARNYLKTI